MAVRNGNTVLVYMSASPADLLIAGQRDVTFTETHPAIDASDKSTNTTTLLQGRYDASIDFTVLYNDTDAQQDTLRAAIRAGTNVILHRYEDASTVESATGLITSMTENHPDQDVSTASITVRVTGAWA